MTDNLKYKTNDLTEIMESVSLKMGYAGNKFPEIIVTDKKLFVDDKPVSACYKRSHNTIYVSNPNIVRHSSLYGAGLNLPECRTALIAHEMTHFVQWEQGENVKEICVSASERDHLTHPLEDHANDMGCHVLEKLHGLKIVWSDHNHDGKNVKILEL